MPVTRSQRGTSPSKQSTAPTPAEDARGTTDSSGTSGSSGTLVEGTLTTSYESQVTSDSEATRKKEEVTAAATPGANKKTRSVKSTRRREMEAKVELARRQLEEAQAAAALAKCQWELLQAENESEAEDSENEEWNANVHTWVQSTVDRMSGKGHQGVASGEGRRLDVPGEGHSSQPPAAAVVKPEDRATASSAEGARELAEAIVKAINVAPKPATTQPSYVHELPSFDGDPEEWIAFRTVYEDTAPLFSDVQNMARLRRAMKGTAREAVKSLLYSECPPEEVIEALRRRFGRPEALILAELEKVRCLPRISDNARDICVFASRVNNTVATVRGLRKPQYLHSPEMVKVIVEKMPAVLRYRWYDYAAEKEDEEPDLILMSRFLNREADRCGPYAAQELPTTRQPPRRQYAHAASEYAETSRVESRSEDKKLSCPHCQGEHYLYECRKFLQKPTKERWDIAKKSNVCFKCLQGRHRKETCRRPACKVCKRWHHPVLHEDRREDVKPTDIKVNKEIANNVMLPVNVARTAKAYLKMVPVELYGPRGAARILALLDEGSTVTLLDSAVARRIGLEGPVEALTLETVGGKTISKGDSMRLNMKIRGLHQTKKRTIAGARTIDDICLTPQRLDKKRLEECAHLKHMTDQLFYEEESPKLLIGQDNWELIVSRATRKGKRGQPVASLTYLGWVLHGSDGATSRPVNFVTCAHVSSQDELERVIKEHFAVDSLGIQPRRPTTDIEKRALDVLEDTTRRLDSGRFETGLLWKNKDEKMPDNYTQAENRLKTIERKLDKDAALKQEYEGQIKNLLNSGYAEEVQHTSSSEKKWYLPHFAVTHPTKKKIRIVFDAAAKCQGKSLNDALLPGPDLLQSLFGVLLRFRQQSIAVVADIKEMFLQIKIREEDRDSLRFLWRGDQRSGAPKEYRMTSVIFGAACSPSAAIYVKNKNAADFKEEYPEATLAIERNHYMDDYLQSFGSREEAVKIASQVDVIHKKAGFELRGWASNDEEVLKKLTSEANNEEIELGTKEEKTLGLRWFTGTDEIGFRSCLRNVPAEVVNGERTPTKREVTSAVMSTFDPLGLASPVLIQGKKLIQSIWRSGVDWDDSITAEDTRMWEVYVNNLQCLRDLRVPRCVAQCNTEGELHTFVDASEEAYACAVYLRQRDVGGGHRVTLLAGKARVTPLKPVSVPRLELQAALLGARMARSVSEELDIVITKRIYWSDSSTVLSWIKADPRTFKTFVAHRLAEIEDTTRPQEWRWVPTALNPADDATRDVPKDFGGTHRWFNGPPFLTQDEEQWPTPRTFKAEPTGEEKEKSTVAATKHIDRHPTPNPVRFSSWTRLVRATARVLQFIELCQRKTKHQVNVSRKSARQDPTWKKNMKKAKPKKKPIKMKTQERRLIPLEPSQIKEAERRLLYRSQEETFKEEISCVKKGKPFDKNSKLRKLDVVYEDGLLRLRGRIDAAMGTQQCKKPVVLDSKHHITRLLIAHYHEVFNHGNHATVINELRQRFWILGLRSTVRSTVHRCQWCKVYRGTPQHQPTGNLPRERLRHGEPPFTCTAVDYFGPMSVTVGRRHEKRWGALFTCLTTRAVHVELAASLSTDSMILALRRMAARRGMPKTIFSDNGTNFVGASKELQEALADLKQDDIITAAEKMSIRWKFIPPGAPNMGGAWERLVRSIKTALAVTLKERHPQEEVLHTLLLEAEHLVNSRPLIEADEDNEEGALTPNHFLIGRSCGAARMGTYTDDDLTGRRTWRTAQRLADHFWSRWVKEYLPTLIPRRVDARAAVRDLQCGDTVLIVDSTLPRGAWPRGEVVRTFPGPDGRTRVLEVRTTGGVLKRPSSKVVLLVPAQREGQAVVEQRSNDTTDEPDCGEAVTASDQCIESPGQELVQCTRGRMSATTYY